MSKKVINLSLNAPKERLMLKVRKSGKFEAILLSSLSFYITNT